MRIPTETPWATRTHQWEEGWQSPEDFGGEEGVRWAGIGEEGIRTPDTVSGIPDFESGAFSHSATSPEGCLQIPPSNAQGRGLLAD